MRDDLEKVRGQSYWAKYISIVALMIALVSLAITIARVLL